MKEQQDLIQTLQNTNNKYKIKLNDVEECT
jgi:hypothetical protein